MKPEDFIRKIAPYAMEDYTVNKILPSLTIAQAALESGWGESGLTRQGNNLFGVKGVGNAGSVKYMTNEYVRGVKTRVEQAFRHYKTWGDSVADHSRILLLARYKGIPGNTDYKDVCTRVQNAGYATDPNYSKMLIKMIDQYVLTKYDILAFEMVKEDDEMQEIKGVLNGVDIKALLDRDGRAWIPANEMPKVGVNASFDNKNKVVYLTSAR
ncbi:Exo-glucosaminidase LytG precursor [compost metagenome]